jgi:hypothetical protein
MSDEFVFDDGRKAEKVEIDQGQTKVIEIYVEPKPEKKLAQRITEKYCVCEREIETIDEYTGEIVGRTIEKVDNGQVVASSAAASANEPVEADKSPMEKLVEDKINNKNNLPVGNMILVGVIVAQLLGLAYLLFVV